MLKMSWIVAAMAMCAAMPAAAVTLNAGIAGNVSLSTPTPVPGVQVFTLTGNFTSYFASPDLPQIAGNDLDQYSFTVSGTSSNYDDLTRTATYSNVTGTINGYGQVVQNLAPTTLTVTFDPSFATGAVLGALFSTGPVTPPGFPGPIDFSPANGAVIAGTFVSQGPQGGTFTGSIATVPEPMTWAMLVVGFGLVGTAARRRAVAA